MFVVYNKSYGGWDIPYETYKKLGLNPFEPTREDRTDPDLIEWVRAHPDGDLTLAEIPDDATDWDYWEYDGAETVFYVQNGKIKYY